MAGCNEAETDAVFVPAEYVADASATAGAMLAETDDVYIGAVNVAVDASVAAAIAREAVAVYVTVPADAKASELIANGDPLPDIRVSSRSTRTSLPFDWMPSRMTPANAIAIQPSAPRLLSQQCLPVEFAQQSPLAGRESPPALFESP